MWSTAREIAAGDTVIIWLTRDQVQPLVVTPGKDYNTKFGNFRQADFVGVPYGSKVASRTGRGFVHVLRPTPELWTVALPHRTQILYLADIAFISAYLGIKKGSRVIEAGTGSASFSHSVARTIGSSGRLYSYEFHEARYIKAKEEFARHGLSDIITLNHRNVCKDGFTVKDEVDSVFLDLPAPWDAVEHAKTALRKDRVTRICCFSPCIEQVLRTVTALNDAGFTQITMHETLLRPIEVFQTPSLPSIHDLPDKLRLSEAKREEKRQRQIRANREAAERKAAAAAGGGVAGGGTGTGKGGELKRKVEDVDEEEEEGGGKRVRIDVEDEDIDMGAPLTTTVSAAPASSLVSLPNASTSTSTSTSTPTPTQNKINVSKALPEVRGHTSYLTFACLVPNPGHAGSSSSAATSTTASTSSTTPCTPAVATTATSTTASTTAVDAPAAPEPAHESMSTDPAPAPAPGPADSHPAPVPTSAPEPSEQS